MHVTTDTGAEVALPQRGLMAFFTHVYAYDDEIRVELAEPFATLFKNDVADAAQTLLGTAVRNCPVRRA